MKHIIGGIGDILLSMEEAQKMGKCDVYSHYKGARDMLVEAGVRVRKNEHYDELNEDFKDDALPTAPVARTPFPSFKYPVMKPSHDPRDCDKPCVGIHPFGSYFSNKFWGKKGYPIKRFTDEVLIGLVDKLTPKYQVLIFGTTDEVTELGDIWTKGDHVHMVARPIWEAIAIVHNCEAVIATDSAIKAASAIARIPTYVYMGNYQDPWRDSMFIDPYIREGVMKAFYFQHCDVRMFEPVLEELM